MKAAARASSLVSIVAAVPLLAQCGAGVGPTVEDLVGAWSGTMTHAGESETFAMELEPAEEGKVALELTLPAMNMIRQAVGSVPPEIEGNEVRLGPFTFTYDRGSQTLSGTMPASMVPVHEIPITLRRVETIEVGARPGPSAPAAEPAWTFDAGAALWPGATFADGVVYAGDDEGRLHALDARSGKTRWSFHAGGPIRTRALVAGGAVFIQADDGVLYRLDATRGKETWRTQVVETPIERLPPTDSKSRFDSFGSDVTLAEGRLFFGTHDGRVLAVDPKTGKTAWESAAEGSVLAAPAVADGRVYFGSFDGCVHALDAATGAPLWKRDTKGAVLSTPALAGELLVVGNRSYDLLGLDQGTGEVAWTGYIWFSWVESSATVRDGVAYLGSSDAAAAFAYDAATGQRLWQADVFGWSWGQPAVTEDRVYVGTSGLPSYMGGVRRGGVMALERATGRAVWRYAADPPTEGTWGFPGSPAVGAGHVFVTGLDGHIYAFPQ